MDIVDFQPGDAPEWRRFLEESNNGTLFHDLDFLAYHRDGKFQTRHLLFKKDGNLLALLPAAMVLDDTEQPILKSPYGASVGGFVLPVGQSAGTAIQLVQSLQERARSLGAKAVELRLAPSLYMRDPNDNLGFALFANKFQLTRRWLSPIIRISTDAESILAHCAKSKVRDFQNGLRKGLRPREVDSDQIGEFYRLLMLTWSKHGTQPTHSKEDVENLFRRVPKNLRLFLCEHQGQEIAAVLVFILNRQVAYTFYICQDETFRSVRPGTVLVLHIAQILGAEGTAYLDLGPSSFDDLSLNHGLVSFKEELGARGACRDTWRWDCE